MLISLESVCEFHISYRYDQQYSCRPIIRRRKAEMQPTRATPAELEVLQAVWAHGSGSVKHVCEWMEQQGRSVTYAQVLRIMQIMHRKGLLIRDSSQRRHIYAPACAREFLQAILVKNLIDQAFAGSVTSLVRIALQAALIQEERDEIGRIFAERYLR